MKRFSLAIVSAALLASVFFSITEGRSSNTSLNECCSPTTGGCNDLEFCEGVMDGTLGNSCSSSASPTSCADTQKLQDDLENLRKLSLADFVVSAIAVCLLFLAPVIAVVDLVDFFITLTIVVRVKRLDVVGAVERIIQAGCFTGAGNEITLSESVGEYNKLLSLVTVECALEFVGVLAHVLTLAEPISMSVLEVVIDIIELAISGIVYFQIIKPSLEDFHDLMASFDSSPDPLAEFVPCVYSCCVKED